MSIKTIARGLVVACCAALGFNAWAKTIAYWDGDITEGSSKAGWTLSAGLGATINADGTVTTEKKDGGPQNLGLILSRTDDYTSNALTLVFKYSGLDVCEHNVSMAEMVWGNGETMNKHVARIGSSASNCGMSDGSRQLNAASYTIPTAGMMAISMSNSDGMRISFQAEDATSFTDAAWYTGSDVKLGTKFGSMKIGGCDYASTSYHRPGMKIEAVAIVDEVFESGSTYSFPDAPATYAKSSLSAYINETTAQTLIPNATLEDLLNGTIKGKINGGNITSGFKDNVVTASYVTRVPADGDIEKVTLQFKLREGNMMSKVVFAECVQDGADVKIKATGAKHTTSARTYGNDATTWAGGGTVVTSASAAGYGIHEITFNVPYDTVKTIRESTTWADAGVAAPEAGKKTIVYVHGGATVTFADDTIPAGIVLASKMENDGIAVAGTIPMLTTDEALTILADTTATIKPGYRGKVVAKGTAQFTGANNTDYHSDIELAGGTLKVTSANTGSGSMQFYKLTLTDDSTIDAAVNFYTIASQYGRFNFGLNGHTLTKKGTGTYYVYTPTLVGGGAIDVQDGTLTLKDAKLETGATLTMTVAAGKTLKFEGATDQLTGTLKLLKGSFQAPVDTLTVEVPEGYELTKTTASSMTTYTATRTTAMNVYATGNAMTAFVFEDNTAVSALIDDDVVYVKNGYFNDSQRWSIPLNVAATQGHKIVFDYSTATVEKAMTVNTDVPANQEIEIATDTILYIRDDKALNAGVLIGGAGTLALNDQTITVNGAVTISSQITFAGTAVIKLADGATLTIAKLEDEGAEITKVTTDVTGKHVEYADGKYSLVTATYKVKVPTVANATVSAEGYTADEDGYITVNHGASVTFTVTPNEGYNIGSATTITVENVTAAVEEVDVSDIEITEAKTYVAQIGETKYETIAEAVAQGGEIVLLADIELTGAKDAVVIPATFKGAIDFGTHTISRTANSYYVMDIVAGAELTLKGTTGGLKGTPVASGNTKDPASLIRNKGNLTILSGVYTSDYTVVKNDEDPGKGVLIVEGGALEIIPNDKGYIGLTFAIMNWTDATINGGTFNGNVQALSYNGNNVCKASTMTINGGTFVVPPTVYMIAYDKVQTPTITVKEGVEIAVVNASAESLELEVKQNGNVYTLGAKVTGPTSWDDVKDDTDVTDIVSEETAEALADSNVTAKDIATWAAALAEKGVTVDLGAKIPVNALIFNVAPDAVPADPVAAADTILEELASKVDISAMTAGTLDADTLELLEKQYPMAKIELKEVTTAVAGEGATNTHLFKLSIELKK